MQSKIATVLLAAFIVPLLLSACGGDNPLPYDGTWNAVLTDPSITSTPPTFVCTTPPAVLIIKNDVGTTTQYSTCITTAASSVTTTTPYFVISVNIQPNPTSGQKDVLNAIVNGATFTGSCISNIACSATNGTDNLSLTR